MKMYIFVTIVMALVLAGLTTFVPSIPGSFYFGVGCVWTIYTDSTFENYWKKKAN